MKAKPMTEAISEEKAAPRLVDRLRAIVAPAADKLPTMADIDAAERELHAQLSSIQDDIHALEDALVLSDDEEARARLIALRSEAAIVERRIAALAQPAEAARLRSILADFEQRCAEVVEADNARQAARRKLEAAQSVLREATNAFSTAALAHQSAVQSVGLDFNQSLSPADRHAMAVQMAEIKHRYGLLPDEDYQHIVNTHNQENQ